MCSIAAHSQQNEFPHLAVVASQHGLVLIVGQLADTVQLACLLHHARLGSQLLMGCITIEHNTLCPKIHHSNLESIKLILEIPLLQSFSGDFSGTTEVNFCPLLWKI